MAWDRLRDCQWGGTKWRVDCLTGSTSGSCTRASSTSGLKCRFEIDFKIILNLSLSDSGISSKTSITSRTMIGQRFITICKTIFSLETYGVGI